MRKPTYEEQNAWLSKYVAPVFLDLNFGPIIDATIAPIVKSTWEKYVTIPREIRSNRSPEAKEQMRDAGVYDSLQRLDFEGSMGGKFRQILMGNVPENGKPYKLVGDVGSYTDNKQFATDVSALHFDLGKKPLEILENRIDEEVMKFAKGAATEDQETQFRRDFMIRSLLRDYSNRTKPEDRDPLFMAHMAAFQVRERGDLSYNLEMKSPPKFREINRN